MAKPSESKLRAENEELRRRLEEAEQALEAIRTGQVESLVVEGPEGPRIFTLEGATQSVRVLIEAMNEGAVTLGDRGTILYCNARFAGMLGKPLQKVMGSSLRDHVPERSRADFDALLARTRDSGVREEIPLRATGGEEIPVYLSISAIVDGGRRVLCVVATDLRERKRAEAIALAELAARASEERLWQTLRYASAGTWALDFASGAVAWSPESYRLYGLEPREGPLTRADWERAVHPQDLPGALAALAACVDGRTSEYRAEFRVPNAQPEERWLLGVGQLERAEDGTPIRLLGLNIDITERKQAEQALREAEDDARRRAGELQAVLDAVPAAVFITRDPEARTVDANRFCAELLRVPPGTNVSLSAGEGSRPRSFRAMRGGVEIPPAELPVQLAAARGEEVRDCELDVVFEDGTVRHLVGNATPLRTAGGQPAGAVGAFVDITDRQRAQDASRASEERLREADRRKDDFLSMLSHELRNPLAPIRNATYILRRTELGSDQAKRAHGVIERQTQHLTRLVDDLLDVTRIARGKIELRRERVDLRETVRRTAEDLRSVIEARGVTFRVDVPDANVWAEIDTTRLAQAVGNLLHNAAKFTRGGDSVRLSLESDGVNAQIRVEDTGAGIAPELLPHVFDKFVQGDRTLARTEGGLGLGLALVKGIVELHGGSVCARSAGKGHGAEFTLRLPVSVRPEGLDRPAPGVASTSSGRRVLVIDDNVDAAQSLAEGLRLSGHVVEVAFDGPTAIEKVLMNPPDVVFCDIGLPGMSGYEVARKLRATGANGMQLIAVSGYAQSEDVTRALEAGFDAHIAKPCDPEQLAWLLT